MSRLIAGALALDGRIRQGWVRIEDGLIVEAAHGRAPSDTDERVDGVIAPALVDLQVNGAAGREVTGDDSDLDAIEVALASRGVGRFLATVVTTDDDTARRAVGRLARHAADPASGVVGVHLEGPFLSPAEAGMHRPELLRTPSDGVPDYFDDPAIRLVTLAPELPGALALIGRLRERGVAVALGHSRAEASVVRRAIDAGAGLVTHMFNAMPAPSARAPGLVGVALADPRLQVAIVADGLHVDATMLQVARRAAGDRVLLVSDASPAACAPPGAYRFAGIAVEREERGRVCDSRGRLAGSGITLDQGLECWMRLTGASLAEGVAAAAERPARLIGLPEAWNAGAPAGLIVLDERGRVRRVLDTGTQPGRQSRA